MNDNNPYAVLFEPVKIGPVTAPNRFYQTPHATGMGNLRPKSSATLRGIKAEGGWGVVCTENCSIHPSSDEAPYAYLSLWDDADAEGLAWMLKDLPVSPDAEALDIATGTGEFARALAPHVAKVIGLDATDAMLEQGKHFIEQAGIENITFRKGIVQKLPFEDETFDIVSSRYAFHHFADPKPVISEMARVCKTGGHVIIVDHNKIGKAFVLFAQIELLADTGTAQIAVHQDDFFA